MDLYLLDKDLRRETILDLYESLIWTERFKDVGEFSLSIRSDGDSRRLLTTGKRVCIAESKRVMTIETVESSVSDEGVALLQVSGRSLESLLDDRVARYGAGSLTENPRWEINDILPADLARKLFHDTCVANVVHPEDNIPEYAAGTDPDYPDSLIPEPAEPISVSIEPNTVLAEIKNVCDLYNLGFRLIRGYGEHTPRLHFHIYSGNVRTSAQSLLPAVVFSSDLDNLSGTTDLTTIAGLKNVAYVYAKNGSLEVLQNEGQPEPAGLDRRVLIVKADDITLSAGPALQSALRLRGLQALSGHRPIIGFDGEIPQTGSYVYERDYFLGDMVETRSEDGVITNMRVTEQIFASDAQGARSYPTLTLDQLITPGSWFGWDANQVWADAGPTTWAEA